MKRHSKAGLSAAVAILVTVASAVPALGQARIWNGGGSDANWSTAANWNVNTPPPLTAPTEGWRFGSTATQLVTNMNNSYSFGQLQFSDVSGYVVNSANGSTMSLAGFNNGQAIAIVAPNTATNVATVNVAVTLNTLNTNPGNASEVNRRTFDTNLGTLNLNGAINAGGFDIRKIGAGSLTLGAANTFASTFEATNGGVFLGTDTSLGTATVLVANGAANTVRYASSSAAARTLANNFTVSGAGVLAFGDANNTGPITLNGTVALNDAANSKPFAVIGSNTLTVNGVISGVGALTKNNPGTLVLTAANTYAGQTTVGSGTLRLTGSLAGTTFVGGGVLEGTGTTNGLGVSTGGAIAPGTAGTVGQLNGSSASFGTGGNYLFDIAGATNDLLLLSGSLTAAATAADPFTITVSGTGFNDATAASYILVDGATTVVGFDPTKFALDTSAFASGATGTFSLALADGDTNLVLNFTPVPEPGLIVALGLGAVTLTARRRLGAPA